MIVVILKCSNNVDFELSTSRNAIGFLVRLKWVHIYNKGAFACAKRTNKEAFH